MLTELANELCCLILFNLPYSDLMKLSLTNKKFNSLIRDVGFMRSYAKLTLTASQAKLYDYALEYKPGVEFSKLYLIIKEERNLIIRDETGTIISASEDLFCHERCFVEAGRDNNLELFEYYERLFKIDPKLAISWFIRGLAEMGHYLPKEVNRDLMSNAYHTALVYGIAAGGREIPLRVLSNDYMPKRTARTENLALLEAACGVAYSDSEKTTCNEYYLDQNKRNRYYNEHHTYYKLNVMKLMGKKDHKIESNFNHKFNHMNINIIAAHHRESKPVEVIMNIIKPIKIIDDDVFNYLRHLPSLISNPNVDFNYPGILKFYAGYVYSKRMKLRTISYYDDLMNILINFSFLDMYELVSVVKYITVNAEFTKEEKINLVKLALKPVIPDLMRILILTAYLKDVHSYEIINLFSVHWISLIHDIPRSKDKIFHFISENIKACRPIFHSYEADFLVRISAQEQLGPLYYIYINSHPTLIKELSFWLIERNNIKLRS